jgi:hypothetical protein
MRLLNMPLPFFFGKPADVIHQHPFVFAHVRGGRKSLLLNQFVKGCFIGFKRGAYGLFVRFGKKKHFAANAKAKVVAPFNVFGYIIKAFAYLINIFECHFFFFSLSDGGRQTGGGLFLLFTGLGYFVIAQRQTNPVAQFFSRI